MSSKRKRASNGQPAAAADEDVTQVEEGARKRSRWGLSPAWLLILSSWHA